MTAGDRRRVVLDTNLFVGAGFNRKSSSAAILKRVAEGELELVWSEGTKRETAHILRKIPRLRWEEFEPLFRPEGEYDGPLPIEAFGDVVDPDDRKFAALAAATGATLVTSDDHLLQHRGRADVEIATPSEFARRLG